MTLRRAWIGACAAVWLTLAAGSAGAVPIFFNGAGGFGISAASADDAEADGVPIVEVAANVIVPANSLNLVIPAPDVLSFSRVSGPTVSNPNRATSEWSVTNGGQGLLSDAWLVFFTSTDYPDASVGFEIDGDDGWILLSVYVPSGSGGAYYFYPARFLGDLDPSENIEFLMHHLVGVPLVQNGSTLVLPQYSVGAVQGVPVPEPQALVLAGFALGLAAILRRRSA